MSEYRPHQIEGGQWLLDTLRKHWGAYLHWQERCGKSGAAIYAVEHSKAKTCLIVTKKRAIEGWNESLDMFKVSKKYKIINYESLHKVVGDFDIILIDEAHHAISSFPKVSAAWKKLFPFCKNKPIVFMSATGYSENLGLIFHQLKLMGAHSPLNYKSFYDFHRSYGIADIIYTPTPRESYKRYKDAEILAKINYLFNFKTRAEVGIVHEPSVNVVEVPLAKLTKDRMTAWAKDKLLTIGDITIPNDSPGKDRTVHYQLSGSTLKDIGLLDTNEKLDYIANNYDLESTAVMAHFILERELLEKRFPNLMVLSSDGHAEGIDLHKIDKLVVYSMSFKTSKYTQRMARQANQNRKTPIIVDILVTDKPGIDRAVYEAVALKKENFVKHSYELALRNIL